MEWAEASIRHRSAENLQGFIFGGSSEGKEAQVFVLSLSNHLFDQPVILFFQFVFGLAFQFGIFL